MFVVASQKSDQPEGTVIDQDPTGGTSVAKGTTVNVIVAGTENADYTGGDTTELVPVPDVRGYLEKDAVNAIESGGNLKASKSYQYSDTVEAGKVISQSPSSGSVQKNSTISIVISQGQKSVTVPSVTGLTQEKATSDLQNEGLQIKAESAYSDTVAEGKVISQSPTSGKIVPPGTTITITVSIGPEQKSYSFNKTYSAPDDAVSATYSVVGSDGVTYDDGTVDVDGDLSISVSDMACASGTVSITWTIETIDEEGLEDTSTKSESHSVKFTKQ
jgi:serine/threonine-protein kinase